MEALQHIRHFTAANPGYMTLQGTNQYLLGREEITVIDVALPTAENVDGILERGLGSSESIGLARVFGLSVDEVFGDVGSRA